MNRITVINAILKSAGGGTYLEIGVDYGLSFVCVRAEKKIALDPQIRLLPFLKILDVFSVKERCYFQLTSDEFFEKHFAVLEPGGINVAFVDGLHTYGQSLRDCHNCLEHLSPGGVIVVHDCNPQTKAAASPVGSIQEAKRPALPDWTTQWSGDVWKTIVNLRSTRPDLEVMVLDCDYGIGLIRKSRAENPLRYSEEEITEMTYADLEANRETLLNLKSPGYLFTFLDGIGE
jgi:spermidine synthase